MQSFNRLPIGLGLPGSLDPSAGAPAATGTGRDPQSKRMRRRIQSWGNS